MLSLKITDSCLEPNKKKELDKIVELYDKSYPTKWNEKIKYFDRENEIRTNDELEEYKVGKTFLGYLIKEKKLILDDNFIKLIFLRHDGLQSCICNQELYLENNKDKETDTSKEKLYLNFYKIELEKVKELITEYKNNKCDIKSNKEKKIEFVKKICETISWGYKKLFTTCDKILKKNDLHPKTFKNYIQLVLGARGDTDWLDYLNCNLYFKGPKIMGNYNKANIENDIIKICNKTVEFNMLVNKYANLASYYNKAPFIRFLLNNGLIMPHRRYPPVDERKGNNVGTLTIGPYKYDIYYDKNQMNKIFFDKFYNFTFYDETNHVIVPPLLRSTTTTTYTELRDLICYLCLPIFCSVVNTKQNRTMLFIPNYDLHQRLLAIQGLPRNYSTYTGRSIEWKWFDEYEIKAKEAITCFCKEFEECSGYGIEPVQYVWYEIMFENENTKKYIFLICSWEEYMTYYRKSEFLIKKTTPNKLYVYNDIIREHAVAKLTETYKIERVNYVWYEITFDDCTTKEYLFIHCSGSEYSKNWKYYKKLKYLLSWGNYYYVYDYEIKQPALNKLREQHQLREPTPFKWREKYLKYKNKYLELKNKYLELKS